MEVDTNELLHRIGAVLRVISDKMDRLIEIGASLEGQVRLPSELEVKTFADADEPANDPEPEHPAGPMPDPGEGYRLLRKDPPEKLSPGDDFWFSSYAEWHKSFHAALGITSQCDGLWFRRKIEAPKPPEPEYRAPVLPWDAGKVCEFSMTGKDWYEGLIVGFQGDNKHPWMSSNLGRWNFARIKKDA